MTNQTLKLRNTATKLGVTFYHGECSCPALAVDDGGLCRLIQWDMGDANDLAAYRFEDHSGEVMGWGDRDGDNYETRDGRILVRKDRVHAIYAANRIRVHVIVDEDTALANLNGGHAEIQAISDYDDNGFRFAVMENHTLDRIESVRIDCLFDDESAQDDYSDIYWIATAPLRPVFLADGRVSDETAAKWFGKAIVIGQAADQQTCEKLAVHRAWRINNPLEIDGQAYVCDDAQGFHVHILTEK